MADQTNFETPKPLNISPDPDSAPLDGGFNRRIGLGLVLSVGANVLLLQGAGMMKNHMNVSPQPAPGGVITMTRATVKATPSPSPMPTPEAKTMPDPTPTPRPVRKPEPTPLPKPVPDPVKPTPTPVPVKPTPPPIAKPVPTVKPDVMPENTKTPVLPAAPTAIQTPAETPAVDTTPAAHEASPRASRQPAVASPAENAAKIISATTPRENSPAADTRFVVDASQSAPARSVADLPRPSLAGQISAAIRSATISPAQTSSALNVATPTGDRAPGQLRTFSNKTPIGGPAGNGSLTPRASDAASNVSMANGGPIAPGSTSAFSNGGPRSNGALISAAAPTTLAPGGGPGVAMSTPGMHGGNGPSGSHRPAHPIGERAGTPGDRGSGPSGGSFGGGFNAGGEGRSPISAATHGAGPVSYSTGPGGDTNLRGTDGPVAIVSQGGNGRGNRPLASGRPGPIHTGDPANGPGISGKLGNPGDGSGTPGFAGVVADGPGKSGGFRSKSRLGGPTGGFDNGKGLDGIKQNGGTPVVTGGTPGGEPKGPRKISGDVSSTPEAGSGSAVNAVYKDPSASSITVPDSLLSVPYDATVTVRVVLQANGEAHVEITHASAYPALDAQVKALCSRIHFKPAMLDGKAVDEPHTFNFHLHNGS